MNDGITTVCANCGRQVIIDGEPGEKCYLCRQPVRVETPCGITGGRHDWKKEAISKFLIRGECECGAVKFFARDNSAEAHKYAELQNAKHYKPGKSYGGPTPEAYLKNSSSKAVAEKEDAAIISREKKEEEKPMVADPNKTGKQENENPNTPGGGKPPLEIKLTSEQKMAIGREGRERGLKLVAAEYGVPWTMVRGWMGSACRADKKKAAATSSPPEEPASRALAGAPPAAPPPEEKESPGVMRYWCPNNCSRHDGHATGGCNDGSRCPGPVVFDSKESYMTCPAFLAPTGSLTAQPEKPPEPLRARVEFKYAEASYPAFDNTWPDEIKKTWLVCFIELKKIEAQRPVINRIEARLDLSGTPFQPLSDEGEKNLEEALSRHRNKPSIFRRMFPKKEQAAK